MIKLTLIADNAKITHVNTRLEKHGPEEKELGTDINIMASVGVDELGKLAVGDEMDYRGFLFTEDGQVKSSGINTISFDRTYEDHNITIMVPSLHDDKGIELNEIKVKKISAVPAHGNSLDLKFQIQGHPTEEQLAFLHDAWKRGGDVMVAISEPAQGDFVEANKDNEAE